MPWARRACRACLLLTPRPTATEGTRGVLQPPRVPTAAVRRLRAAAARRAARARLARRFRCPCARLSFCSQSHLDSSPHCTLFRGPPDRRHFPADPPSRSALPPHLPSPAAPLPCPRPGVPPMRCRRLHKLDHDVLPFIIHLAPPSCAAAPAMKGERRRVVCLQGQTGTRTTVCNGAGLPIPSKLQFYSALQEHPRPARIGRAACWASSGR